MIYELSSNYLKTQYQEAQKMATVRLIDYLQAKYPKERFEPRADGRIEWVCPHNIGHPVYGNMVHGCDGCCESPIYHDIVYHVELANITMRNVIALFEDIKTSAIIVVDKMIEYYDLNKRAKNDDDQ